MKSPETKKRIGQASWRLLACILWFSYRAGVKPAWPVIWPSPPPPSPGHGVLSNYQRHHHVLILKHQREHRATGFTKRFSLLADMNNNPKLVGWTPNWDVSWGYLTSFESPKIFRSIDLTLFLFNGCQPHMRHIIKRESFCICSLERRPCTLVPAHCCTPCIVHHCTPYIVHLAPSSALYTMWPMLLVICIQCVAQAPLNNLVFSSGGEWGRARRRRNQSGRA